MLTFRSILSLLQCLLGVYSHYYSIIRNRNQTPHLKYLANVTVCEYGPCTPTGNTYYEGMLLA